jgi:lysozyme
MNISKKGITELWGHEGICLRPYLDSVGVWTIGMGATASEGIDIKSMSKTDYISMQYALDLFNKGIVKYENAVNKALKVPISQEQFDALVSICYNIGVGGLTKSTFMKRINAGNSLYSISQAIMMWKIPKEIIARRAKEAKLFTTGQYSNNGMALQFDTNGVGKVQYSKGKMIKVSDYL